MESPPEDQRNREDTPAVKETMHKTKTIQFFGRTTPIILQNDNGPCPLLAICNTLLLRNNLNLSSDISEVSQEKLLSLVAERLIDANSNNNNKDADFIKNQERNIEDAIDKLPSLTTGIDVNIQFTKFSDFEYTSECAIFDLLDIPLYHGWLVDPQDYDTANAIGTKSYNRLMGELVALETQNMENVSKKIPEEKENTEEQNDILKSLKLSETVDPNSEKREIKDDLITFEDDKESDNGQMNKNVSEIKEIQENKDEIAKTSIEQSEIMEESDPSPPVEKILGESSLKLDVENVNTGEEKLNESCSSAPIIESKYSTSSADVNEPISILETNTTTNESLIPKNGITAKQGELIKNFLKNSASQLTIYGLFSLQEGLKERELCVFFRNNHFNTMFKLEGELYILATDQGYLNQPDLVWEKLNEVNGDTVFVDSNFKKFKAESHEIHSWDEQNVMANTADYLAKIDNTEEGDTGLSSDMQLAIALQQQEFEQQQQQAQRTRPQSPTVARSGLVVGPQHVHPARPRNSSKPEPKQSKDKCTIM